MNNLNCGAGRVLGACSDIAKEILNPDLDRATGLPVGIRHVCPPTPVPLPPLLMRRLP